MPRLEFMDAAAQRRLIDLASNAVAMARDTDLSPTEALAKVAADSSLNADEINRVKEAINTAAVLALRKRAAAGDGCADDVTPLVDGDAVRKAVFKTAAEPFDTAMLKVAADIVPETIDFNRAVAPALEKVAAAPVETRTRERLFDHATASIGMLKVAAEQHADQAFAHRTYAERAISSLVESLKRTDAPAFAEVEKTAMALHPGAGLDTVCNVVFAAGDLGRIGHSRYTGPLPKYASTTDHAEHVAALLVIRDEIGRSLVEKLAAEELRGKAERGDIGLFKLGAGAPNKPGNDDDDFGVGAAGIIGGVAGTGAGLATSLGEDILSGAKSISESTEDMAARAVPRAGKASINERLKSELGNDRMRLVLNKVMNNDPVVSKYPEDKVVQAYNAITTLQPSLTAQPLALRSALRRYLASGGDFTMQEAMQLKNFNKAAPTMLSPEVMQAQA